jgi:hypothetical protein
MAQATYFVPTDGEGRQQIGDDVTTWALPRRLDDGSFDPGHAVEPAAGAPIVLRDLDGLLEDLGERIFVAEAVGPEGSGTDEGSAAGARLVAETAWNLHEAARFALDCAEHALGELTATTLPSGTSLAEVFSSARQSLDRDEKTGDGLVERISRLALARRLRHLGDDVADSAFTITVADEAADLDAFDDPSWTLTAAARDAVLSATEAIRHDALPRLLEGQNRRYESDSSLGPPGQVLSTPWGNFTGGNRAGVVPAWVAARDAAERARQAVADADGAGAGTRERQWQRDRLAEALGTRAGEAAVGG